MGGFDHACKLVLEGTVSKRRDHFYRSGRSKTWHSIHVDLDGKEVFPGVLRDHVEGRYSVISSAPVNPWSFQLFKR
jgi:hypothetical protein